MTRLVILGAGGHGKVVADAAACQGCWSDIVFLDDRWPNIIKSGAWPIVGSIADHVSHISSKDSVVVAIGNSSVRLALLKQLVQTNRKLATITHPSAVVSQYAQIGAGSVVFANAVVNIDAVLGLGCIVNTGAVVEHDVVLGEGVCICPGHVSDVHTWIASASVFVLPSYREGLPRSTQEAMAVGRAVITTDVPGCRETVVNGVNGFLIPVRSVDALVQAMEKFVVDPNLIDVMGKASRDLAEQKYDVHKVNTIMLSEMGCL